MVGLFSGEKMFCPCSFAGRRASTQWSALGKALTGQECILTSKYLIPLRKCPACQATAKMHTVLLHVWYECKISREPTSYIHFLRWMLRRMDILILGIKKQRRVTGTVCLCVSPLPAARGKDNSAWLRGRNGLLGPWLPEPCALSCGQRPARDVTVIDLIIWIIIRHKQRAFMFPNDGPTLRKWPNPSSWEMRGSRQLSAKRRVPFQAEPCQRLTAASGSSPWNVRLEKKRGEEVMIKVMLLTIQIRAAGRVQTVEWASLRQWPFDLVRKLVGVFSSTHSKLQESQEWTVPHSCTLGYFLLTTFILALISTGTHMAEIN